MGRLEYCVIEKNTREKGLEITNDIFCDVIILLFLSLL